MTVKNRPVRRTSSTANPFENNKKYLTDTIFLIGNGNSRKVFDLERLRPYGTIIGCNALFRDFSPDILLAIDAKMLREIKVAEYCSKDNLCILPGNRGTTLPGSICWKTDKYNTTGCFGMKLISQVMKPTKCYMLGMDGFPGNIYDKTVNYAVNSLQNFNGVNSFYSKTLSGPGETIYVNVNDKDAWPKECAATGKYEFMTYETFEELVMV